MARTEIVVRLRGRGIGKQRRQLDGYVTTVLKDSLATRFLAAITSVTVYSDGDDDMRFEVAVEGLDASDAAVAAEHVRGCFGGMAVVGGKDLRIDITVDGKSATPLHPMTGKEVRDPREILVEMPREAFAGIPVDIVDVAGLRAAWEDVKRQFSEPWPLDPARPTLPTAMTPETTAILASALFRWRMGEIARRSATTEISRPASRSEIRDVPPHAGHDGDYFSGCACVWCRSCDEWAARCCEHEPPPPPSGTASLK